MNTTHYVNEAIQERIGVFEDTAELSEALLAAAKQARKDGRTGDDYLMTEAAEHMVGMFADLKTFAAPKNRIIRIKQVTEMTGLTRSMIYQLTTADKFPRQIKLHERVVGWVESDVQQWIESKIKEGKAA